MNKELQLTDAQFVAGAFLAEEELGGNAKHLLLFEEELQDYIACVIKQLTERGYTVKIIPSVPHLERSDFIFANVQDLNEYFRFVTVEGKQAIGVIDNFFWSEVLTTSFFLHETIEVFQIMTNDESFDALFYRREHAPVYFCEPKDKQACIFKAIQYNSSDNVEDLVNKVYYLSACDDISDSYRDELDITMRSRVPYNGWVVTTEVFGKPVCLAFSDEEFQTTFNLAGVDAEIEQKVQAL